MISDDLACSQTLIVQKWYRGSWLKAPQRLHAATLQIKQLNQDHWVELQEAVTSRPYRTPSSTATGSTMAGSRTSMWGTNTGAGTTWGSGKSRVFLVHFAATWKLKYFRTQKTRKHGGVVPVCTSKPAGTACNASCIWGLFAVYEQYTRNDNRECLHAVKSPIWKGFIFPDFPEVISWKTEWPSDINPVWIQHVHTTLKITEQIAFSLTFVECRRSLIIFAWESPDGVAYIHCPYRYGCKDKSLFKYSLLEADRVEKEIEINTEMGHCIVIYSSVGP